MEATAALAILKRIWPFVLGGLALAAIGFLYMDNKATHADLKTANEHVATVTAANAGLAKAIDDVKVQRVDNDAIATAVAGKLAGNVTRETNTRTIIERAVASDPQVRAWAQEPVPGTVRAALRAP